MKHLIIISLLFLLYSEISKAQTNANIPGPENVLVVYNSNSDTSILIKNYYVSARNIPGTNVLPLSFPREVISVGNWSDPHVVKLGFDNQNIVDSTWAKWDSSHCVDTAKFHAWQYFIEKIANPIRDHLETNNLTETIRYIVMCQGVPFKIQAVGDWSSPGNIGVDGLLCMLNTEDYDDFIETIFNNLVNDCYPGCAPPPYDCYSSPIISNPYFDEDSNFDFDSRFEPDYYTGSYGGYNYKLSYLVSRLDGLSFEIIKDIIDKSVDADKSGEAAWIIDNDLTYSFQNGDYTETKDRLEDLDFNVVYENTNTWVSHNTYNGDVMGYTSLGTHAEGGNPSFTTYIQDSLLFDYANGSIFNTYESFNAYSIGTIRRAGGQGLMTEFTLIGGTSGAGHIWEPFASGVSKDYVYFPYYAMGYNQIDAVWQGFSYLAWRNVVVGDPLTAIAWGKQTLTDNLSWRETNLVTGEITIPLADTLTLEDDAVVNFKHNGFITGEGFVITDGDFTINILDWEESIFRSAENNHPKIIWGAHPDDPLVDGYKIYRKFQSLGYSLIDSVDESTFEYIDEVLNIINPSGETPKNVQYYVTSVLQVGPGTEESDPSNMIDYWVEVAHKINIAKNESEINYNLSQNYPNPFNPSTTITYSLRDNGSVNIKVYNILGSEVAELVNEQKPAGEYSATFDFSNLASGTYFYVIRVNDFVDVKKMVLLK